MIVAWDILIGIRWQSVAPYDASHAFILDEEEPDVYRLACCSQIILMAENLCPGGRLQAQVPELPICPDCARIAGLPSIPGVTT